MINESNFHIYLDDFVNGLLDEEMELAFVAFLDKHPGILDGEELEEPAIGLDPGFKAGLKKPLVLDAGTSDEWLIASMEGDLNEKQERQLGAYIIQHPELEKDKALFALTVLKPDMNSVFPNKEKLKHRPALYLYARWSSAVAAVLLLGFLFFRPSAPVDINENGPLVSKPDSVLENALPVEKEKASMEAPLLVQEEVEYKRVSTQSDVQPLPKKNELVLRPKEINQAFSLDLNSEEPKALELPETTETYEYEQLASANGQSVWQWAYKKIRKKVGAEERIVPERQIPGDALNLVLAKVAPAVQFDQNEGGSFLRIGSFEINRKTARQ